MKTNYPWLQEMKRKEKEKSRPVNRTNIMIMGGSMSGAQPPINQPSQMQFTGYGEDGILQPDKPTEMVNTTEGQRLIHEGEVKVQYPDGNTVVVPAKDLPQKKLQKLQEKGMKGFQAGGVFQAKPVGAQAVGVRGEQQPVGELSDDARRRPLQRPVQHGNPHEYSALRELGGYNWRRPS